MVDDFLFLSLAHRLTVGQVFRFLLFPLANREAYDPIFAIPSLALSFPFSLMAKAGMGKIGWVVDQIFGIFSEFLNINFSKNLIY